MWKCPFHRDAQVVMDSEQSFCTVQDCFHYVGNKSNRRLYEREMWDCFLASQGGDAAAMRREAELLELFGFPDKALGWWLKAAKTGDEDARQYIQYVLFEQGEDEYRG